MVRRRAVEQRIQATFIVLIVVGGLFYAAPPMLGSLTSLEARSSAQFLLDFQRNLGKKASNSFVPLTDPEIEAHFRYLIEALLADNVVSAQQALAALERHLVSYRLVRINDDATGQTVYGLLERVQPGNPQFRGWGALLVRPQSAGHTIYQAPHVLADQMTESITLQAFMHDPAARLAMFAGTHRYAKSGVDPWSDVAHHTSNLFHQLTEYLAQRGKASGQPFWFVQFHGSRTQPNEPLIIAANGAVQPQFTEASPLVRIAQRMHSHNQSLVFGVCGWSSGPMARGAYRLCATENVQGHMLEAWGLREYFVHIELSHEVRREYLAQAGAGHQYMQELLTALRAELYPVYSRSRGCGTHPPMLMR
jgi:hypothetical protein